LVTATTYIDRNQLVFEIVITMRLKDPGQKLASEGGASADILDQILGTTERKRARPASSLDVKVASDDGIVRPPVIKKKKKKKRQEHHAYEQNSVKTTRARGGGGIPQTKFDFSDLEGMTEEEIMQALYDDPKLAAAAAAAAEKMKKSESTKTNKPPKQQRSENNGGNNYKRSTTSRTVSSHPEHLRAMMEEGVPIKQWIVLLVLIGVGLYQLKKATFGFAKKNVQKSKKVEKSFVRKGSKKKGKKGKFANRLRSLTTVLDKSRHDKDMHTTNGIATEKVPALKRLKISKKKTCKEKQRPKTVRPSSIDTGLKGSHESPDTISTDGSSSVNDHQEVQPSTLRVSHENLIVEKSECVTQLNSHDDIIVKKSECSAHTDSYEKVIVEDAKSLHHEENNFVAKDQKSRNSFQAITEHSTQTRNEDSRKRQTSNAAAQEIKNQFQAESKDITLDEKSEDLFQAEKVDNGGWHTVDPKSRKNERKINKPVFRPETGEMEKGKQGSDMQTLEEIITKSEVKMDSKFALAIEKEIKNETCVDSSVAMDKSFNDNNAETASSLVATLVGGKTSDDTTEDEAIAKQLQLEEERLAKREPHKCSLAKNEFEWEEVATKKKNRGTKDDAAIAKQLQLEEDKLAIDEATNNTIAKEAKWEEVTTKKNKKGKS